MKYKVKYKEITLEQEDLMNILSVGTYGSNNIAIRLPKESQELYNNLPDTEGDSLEDKWARVLMNGGKLLMIDMLSEEDLNDWKPEGNTGLAIACVEPELDIVSQLMNDYIKQKRIERGENVENDPKYGCVVYQVGYEDFNRAASSEDGNYYMDIFEEGDDDYYTGWNFLQLVMFGEVIYG